MPKPAKASASAGCDADQDETTCLLDSPGHHLTGNGSNASSVMSTPSFRQRDHQQQQQQQQQLVAGEAEKTFYTVCGTTGTSMSEPVSMASIAAVRDILSDIESKGDDAGSFEERRDAAGRAELSCDDENKENSCLCASSTAEGSKGMPASPSGPSIAQDTLGMASSFPLYHRGGALSATSSSLVVDVHLPPDELQQQQQQAAQPPQKICKHSVSRFQRCYSDGSQAQHCSPKRKARAGAGGSSGGGGGGSSFLAQRGLSGGASHQRYSCGDPKVTSITLEEDIIIATTGENPDKIETVSDATAGRMKEEASQAESTATNSTPLKERLRHFSESTHSSSKKLAPSGIKGKRGGEQHSASSSAPRSSLFHFISHKKKPDAVVDSASVVLPTSMINPNVKLDVFQTQQQQQQHRRSASADSNRQRGGVGFEIGGVTEDDDDDDDDDDLEEDELATTDLLKKTKNKRRGKKMLLEESHLSDASDGGGKLPLTGGTYFTPDSPFRDWNTARRDTASCLSQSSSTVSMPACRICQLPAMEPNNSLISPCRCLGSIRYVHNNCLLKWLEVSSRRRNGPPCCELCQYQYLRHKKFVISHWRFPECSLKDKVLHLFFIFCVCIMIACAAVTIVCFKEERWPYRHSNKYQPGELTPPELISLSCAILFFSAFFLAMYVELKAKHTVYQLVCKFFYMNHEWSVEEYDRKRDIFRKKDAEDGHG